ncbi:hypothetical protein ACU18_12135 [Arthrobacter sp. ZBG10]|nr:hypothetical protein ACU18_12135 [Arthrobacter sp. ZBG10]
MLFELIAINRVVSIPHHPFIRDEVGNSLPMDEQIIVKKIRIFRIWLWFPVREHAGPAREITLSYRAPATSELVTFARPQLCPMPVC